MSKKIEVARCSICLGLFQCKFCNGKGLVKANGINQICRGTNLMVFPDELNKSHLPFVMYNLLLHIGDILLDFLTTIHIFYIDYLLSSFHVNI